MPYVHVNNVCVGIPPCGENNGWRRIAFLNMSDNTQMCPSALGQITSPVRSCGRPRAIGCFGEFWSTGGTEYSQVCGRIIAYASTLTWSTMVLMELISSLSMLLA